MPHRLTACLLVLALLVGCGKTGEPPAPEPPPPTALKTFIEEVSNNGYIGSGAPLFQEAFDTYAQANPEKAAAIKTDFDAMLAADGNPDQVKKIAKKISPQL